VETQPESASGAATPEPSPQQRWHEQRERIRILAEPLGLNGPGIVPPEDEPAEVNNRFGAWSDELKPFGNFDFWISEQICVESVNIQNLRRHEFVLRHAQVHRARTGWEIDRAFDAAELAAELADQPEMVSLRLRMSAHGAALMIGRWEALAAILRIHGRWDEAQRALALDLLGVPQALRQGPTRLDPKDGREAAEVILEVIAAEVAELSRLKAEELDAQDARERAAAELGFGSVLGPELRAVRRQLSACQRRLEWYKRALNKGGRLVLPEPKPDRNDRLGLNPVIPVAVPDPAAGSTPLGAGWPPVRDEVADKDPVNLEARRPRAVGNRLGAG